MFTNDYKRSFSIQLLPCSACLTKRDAFEGASEPRAHYTLPKKNIENSILIYLTAISSSSISIIHLKCPLGHLA